MATPPIDTVLDLQFSAALNAVALMHGRTIACRVAILPAPCFRASELQSRFHLAAMSNRDAIELFRQSSKCYRARPSRTSKR